MRAASGGVLAALLASCVSGPSAAPAAAAARSTPSTEAPVECSRRLAARAPSPPAPSPPAPSPSPSSAGTAPPSRLIVHAELSLATLAAELERQVAPRLAEGSGVSLGPAGALEYSVDRGAFVVSVAADQLVVEAPVHGRARACRGQRCYAGCAPSARVRAEIPLWLRPDYRFEASRVSIEFTKGCTVRALGGWLNVDATNLLRSALAPQLERVRREIDQRLPDVRARVEQGWDELARPRPLPLGGCLVLQPQGLVQGPVEAASQTARARFALLARPELRTACDDAPPRAPLPPLSADPALPDEGVVTLGMELPLASLARAFESARAGASATPRIRVTRATVSALGEHVSAELELAGELCGPVTLQAEPVFAGEDGFVELAAGQLDATESARVRAAGLDPNALAAQLARLPRASAPLSLPLLRAAPPALAGWFSDPSFALSVRVASVRAAGAAARGEHLVAWAEARGSLWLEQTERR